MKNTLQLIAQVQHSMKEDASDQLEAVADKQQTLIGEKKKAREVQEAYDHFTSDEVIDFNELKILHELRSDHIGTHDENFWDTDGRLEDWAARDFETNPWKFDSANINSHGNGNNDGFYIEYGTDSDDSSGVAAMKRQVASMLEGINTEIENHTEGLEDSESDLQLKIQLASGALQNAEQLESKAAKLDTDGEKNVLQNIG